MMIEETKKAIPEKMLPIVWKIGDELLMIRSVSLLKLLRSVNLVPSLKKLERSLNALPTEVPLSVFAKEPISRITTGKTI